MADTSRNIGRGRGGGGGAKFSTCMHLIITVHLEPVFMIGQLVDFTSTSIAATVTNLTLHMNVVDLALNK